MWPNRWKTVTAWACLLLAVVIILLAARALVAPADTAAAFGVPLVSEADGGFVRVYAARNVALAGAVVALLVLGHLTPLAVLMSVIALLPLADMAIVAAHAGGGPVLLRHAVFLVLLASLAAALWRQVWRQA